jgi:hypothetical protein
MLCQGLALTAFAAFTGFRTNSGNFATLAAIRVARGHAVLINCRKVVTLSQSSHDVRHYLRTCRCRVERNLPIIVYASVSNFLHCTLVIPSHSRACRASL